MIIIIVYIFYSILSSSILIISTIRSPNALLIAKQIVLWLKCTKLNFHFLNSHIVVLWILNNNYMTSDYFLNFSPAVSKCTKFSVDFVPSNVPTIRICVYSCSKFKSTSAIQILFMKKRVSGISSHSPYLPTKLLLLMRYVSLRLQV